MDNTITYGRIYKMKKLLGILALGLLWCNIAFSVESLAEGQKGTIKFKSIPVVTLNQFLKGETKGESVQISGKLQFPKKKMDWASSSCCYTARRWWSKR